MRTKISDFTLYSDKLFINTLNKIYGADVDNLRISKKNIYFLVILRQYMDDIFKAANSSTWH